MHLNPNPIDAVYNASTARLQAKADALRLRLEKEKDRVASGRAETALVKTNNEGERAQALEKLQQLEAEFERERQVRQTWVVVGLWGGVLIKERGGGLWGRQNVYLACFLIKEKLRVSLFSFMRGVG